MCAAGTTLSFISSLKYWKSCTVGLTNNALNDGGYPFHNNVVFVFNGLLGFMYAEHVMFQSTMSKIFYPMNRVKIGGEKGCLELRMFPTPRGSHSHGSWHEDKNPYLLRNHIIQQLPGLLQPHSSWPGWLPHWELCNFSTHVDSADHIHMVIYHP